MRKLIFLSLMILMALIINDVAYADSIRLMSGNSLKGLVVEEHEDRVVLSTVDGEKNISRRDIKNIDFDDPAQALMSEGKRLERLKKNSQAISYYQKAYEMNPNLSQARTAEMALRSKMWAGMTQGPVSEISKQQDIENAYRANSSVDAQAQAKAIEHKNELWKGLGIRIEERNRTPIVSEVRVGGDAYKQGMRKGDAIVLLDGKSVRFTPLDEVYDQLLYPKPSSMTLVIERDVEISANQYNNFNIEQAYDGPMIRNINKNDLSMPMPVREKDIVWKVKGQLTRYSPIRSINQRIHQSAKRGNVEISIRREMRLTRK